MAAALDDLDVVVVAVGAVVAVKVRVVVVDVVAKGGRADCHCSKFGGVK